MARQIIRSIVGIGCISQSFTKETPFSLVYYTESMILVEIGEPTLHPRSFHKGDLVWRMTSNARKHDSKFSINQKWPFRVLGDMSKGAYRLERLSNELVSNTWNVFNLKFLF